MVPFLDLQAQYREIKPRIESAIAAVIDTAQFSLGPPVAKFEEQFASYCRTEHCIGVSSGASALHLGLLALGIGPGDEVITVSMTFVATVAAIVYCGAKPVFVDVDPDNWTMDPQQVEEVITSRTKAIVVVHLHGAMADMDPILAIARQYGLAVVEDAAQSHGAEYKGRRAGSIGDIGCFSFYPGKNLGAFGEGGAVVTTDPALARKVRLLRDWGQEKKYHHVLHGYNYRMDAIQAAVLTVKLDYIEVWTESRRALALLYDGRLAEFGQRRPAPAAYTRHVYHVYAVCVADRDDVQRRLGAAGIATGIHYPIPVHLQRAYDFLEYSPGDLPVTEELAAGFLSLPMFPELQREQATLVVQALHTTIRETIQNHTVRRAMTVQHGVSCG